MLSSQKLQGSWPRPIPHSSPYKSFGLNETLNTTVWMNLDKIAIRQAAYLLFPYSKRTTKQEIVGIKNKQFIKWKLLLPMIDYYMGCDWYNKHEQKFTKR